MSEVQAGGPKSSWWREWWSKLAALEAAMDYSETDYLLDRIKHLEGTVREMRAELDLFKARDLEP